MPHRILPAILPCLCLGLLPSVASAQVINEFVGNHTGADLYEFVEIYGAPSTDYSNLTIIQIEGDVGEDAGVVQSVFPVGSTDADGFWWTGYTTDEFENESYTILLVDGWSGVDGADLDVGDDGTLDSTPWTSVVDSVAVLDGTANDISYLSQTDLLANYDGNSFIPGGASRIPDGTDTATDADWVRNDWDGAGLPTLTGSLEPNEALNTAGISNSTSLPPAAPPVLNEVVADHTGADTEEFVEIHGDATAGFSDYWILAVDGDGETAAAIQAGTTNAQGFWGSSLGADALPDGTVTFLLVETWTGSISQDLDVDDDGTLDLTPWTTLVDDVAFDHGAGQTYSTSNVGNPGGASRIPNGLDQDLASDWQGNDFDGAGLPGFGGTPSQGEAWNTPGAVNRTNAVDYYASVSNGDAATLRSTLHAAIDDHTRYPYSSAETDTWDILEQADEDPGNASNVLTIYKNSSEVKFGGGSGAYNREHTWPSSLGFPDQEDGQGPSYPYTDCHHLRLANPTYNSDRGSRAFGTCNAACSERITDVNNGQGGGSGVYPGNSNWVTGADGGTGTWEAWGHRKGDVARSILYMDLRYEGGNHVSGFPEPNLEITDDTGLIQGSGTNTTGTAYMGRLAVVLAWHAADPPDADEMARNEVVYGYQGNRNPFVDHPEWVSCLYQDIGCEPLLFEDGFESGDTTLWSSSTP